MLFNLFRLKQIQSSTKDKRGSPYKLEQKQRSLLSYFKEGFVVAITNPKPIIFFAALFPQFLDTEQSLLAQFSIMTLIFMLFSFMSLSTYGYLAQRAKGFLSNSNNVKWFHRISGGLFVSMGISLFTVKA